MIDVQTLETADQIRKLGFTVRKTRTLIAIPTEQWYLHVLLVIVFLFRARPAKGMYCR